MVPENYRQKSEKAFFNSTSVAQLPPWGVGVRSCRAGLSPTEETEVRPDRDGRGRTARRGSEDAGTGETGDWLFFTLFLFVVFIKKNIKQKLFR